VKTKDKIHVKIKVLENPRKEELKDRSRHKIKKAGEERRGEERRGEERRGEERRGEGRGRGKEDGKTGHLAAQCWRE
jgi:hypothetical protein